MQSSLLLVVEFLELYLEILDIQDEHNTETVTK